MTATHLLRAGVNINTIRAYLGHHYLIYAETDLEMRAKALATCGVRGDQAVEAMEEDKGSWLKG